ncbi:unnamed protein product, partial [Amoebophrya sp. A25]|eukprot:GSA25T00018568001.1
MAAVAPALANPADAFNFLVQQANLDRPDPVRVAFVKNIVQTEFGTVIASTSETDLQVIERHRINANLHERSFPRTVEIVNIVIRDATVMLLLDGYVAAVPAVDQIVDAAGVVIQPAAAAIPAQMPRDVISNAQRLGFDVLQVFFVNLSRHHDSVLLRESIEEVYKTKIARMAGVQVL